MIEVEMTKDMRDYEPKIFGLITTRQLAYIGIGLVIAIPLAIFLPISDLVMRVFVALLAMMPMILCGFLTIYGMHIEDVLRYAVRSHVLCPKNRKYKTESSVDWLLKETVPQSPAQGKKKITASKEYPARR